MKKQLSPVALKDLRKFKGLSHQTLADQAGLVKSTVIELEKQPKTSLKMHAVQARTYSALKRALGATDAQMRGEEPAMEAFPKSMVTLRSKITSVAQMNYDLIEAQYGIRSDQLVQLAPLMFAILVEDSFAWRKEQLKLRQQLLALEEKLRETVYAAKIKGPHEFNIDDILTDEDIGIDQRDPFTEPLEAVNALIRFSDVTESHSFESIADVTAHRITDRFTDFIAHKLKSAPHAYRADLPDINVNSTRNVFDQELRYISVSDLFEYITDAGDEQIIAFQRLAMLTGAVRLRDANPEIMSRAELQAWFTEQLRDVDNFSKLTELAAEVSRQELRGADEGKTWGLDDFGFPVIIDRYPEFKRRSSLKDALTDETDTTDEKGADNVSA